MRMFEPACMKATPVPAEKRRGAWAHDELAGVGAPAAHICVRVEARAHNRGVAKREPGVIH